MRTMKKILSTIALTIISAAIVAACSSTQAKEDFGERIRAECESVYKQLARLQEERGIPYDERKHLDWLGACIVRRSVGTIE